MTVDCRSFQALLIDMDGVLYHGDHVLPGAHEFVNFARQYPYLFVTNNPVLKPEAVLEKLSRLGFKGLSENTVLTSAQAAASWLNQQKQGFSYYAVGATALSEVLSEYGRYDDETADFVVVGEGEGLDYATLTRGIRLIVKQGATLVVTNPDQNVDSMRNGEHVLLPGGGALVAPFEAATGQRATVIGKPEPRLFEMAAARLQVPPGECLMIGDRPDTDILGAMRVGMKTALVRTGRFAGSMPLPAGMAEPDYDVETLPELLHALQRVAD